MIAAGDRLLCKSCAAKAGRAPTLVPPPQPAPAAATMTLPPIEEVEDDPFAGATGADPGDDLAAASMSASSGYGRPKKRKRDLTGPIVGLCVIAAVAAGGYVYLSKNPLPGTASNRPTTAGTDGGAAPDTGASPATAPAASAALVAWEAKSGPEMRSLERLAKAQSKRGDFGGADETYRQLAVLAGAAPGGAIADPALAKLVAGARADWDAIKPKVPQGGRATTASRAEVERLLNEAEFAAKGGSKVAAFERYRDLFALLKGGGVAGADPALAKRLADAAKARRALHDELRSRPDAFDVTAAALLAQGYQALKDGHWQAAADVLADVRLLAERRQKLGDRMRDADLLRALHGVAVARIGARDFSAAADMFDEADTLGIEAKERPTRELLWNRGVMDVNSKFRASRTVRALEEYLGKQEKVDEQLLNLFGTAIAVAFQNPGEDTAALYKSAETYKALNAKLEATRPGEMHWGVEWLPGPAGEALKKQKDAAERNYKRETAELETVRKKLQDVKRGQRTPIKRGKSTIYVTRVDEAALKAVTAEYQAKLAEVNAVRKTIPLPKWLSDLKPMIPGAAALVAGAAGTQPATGPAGDGGGGAARKLARHAAAFPVDRYRLVTAAEPLGDRKEVRVEDMNGNVMRARVVHRDDKLAVLEVSPGDAGRGLAHYNFAIGFAGGDIVCATVPVPSAFGPAAELVKGKDAPRPPTSGPWVVGLEDHPRLAGAPLLDETNRVVGVVVAGKDDPKDKLPAVALLELQEFLTQANALPEEDAETDPPADNIYLVSAEVE